MTQQVLSAESVRPERLLELFVEDCCDGAGSGFLEGPIMITNTHSVGVVRHAVVAWATDATMVPACRRGDVGRILERHKWIPYQTRTRLRGSRQR